MMADLHLPIRPRSDLALINGLIHIVIEHDLVDRDYIDAHTTGFEALRESVREYTPERVAEITGLDARADRTGRRGSTPRAEAAFIGWTMGVNHSTQGHRDRQRHQQPGAHHRQHRPRRRGAVLDHRPVQRDGHARGRASRRACPATASSRARRIARSWRRSGTCRSSGFRPRAASPIPTSSRRRSSGRSARSGSSRPIRSSRSPTSACCSRRSRGSSSSSCRTAFTRRRRPSSPTWCCRRRSGARRKAPTPTPSGASAR